MLKYLMAAKADKARDAHGMVHGMVRGSPSHLYASSAGRGSPLTFKGSPLSGGPEPGGSPSPLMTRMTPMIGLAGGAFGGRSLPGSGGGNGIAGAGDAMRSLEFVPNGPMATRPLLHYASAATQATSTNPA
jgi:hypothetical protein